ncbi:MAG TPA: hypothetical protein VM662_12285 [Sphingomonas sp.]|nr:hypothetical protein [Sphingomonas sp.]
MNRWQALVEIVKSFNERGRPGLALVAVALVLAAGVAMAALPLLGSAVAGLTGQAIPRL